MYYVLLVCIFIVEDLLWCKIEAIEEPPENNKSNDVDTATSQRR